MRPLWFRLRDRLRLDTTITATLWRSLRVNINPRVLTTLALIALLSACAQQQAGAPSHLGVVPSSWDNPNGLGKKCGGQNGVRVLPCPVKLTSQSPKVTVEVSGPGVVSSGYLGSCYDVCSISLVRHGKPVKWRIVSGPSCGKLGLLFQGMNRHNILVGNAALTIVNRNC